MRRVLGGIVRWLEYDLNQGFRVVDFASASRKGEPFAQLIKKRMYLPNVVWRFCTKDLKIGVIKRYIMSLGYLHWTNVIGIRYDEPSRWSKANAIGEKERWDTWLPMVTWKTTKADVLAYWRQMPFDLGLESYQGNCDLCFLKGKNKLKRILTEYPEKADWWMQQEALTGGQFHKNYSIKSLIDLMQRMPTLFDYEDPDITCICNCD